MCFCASASFGLGALLLASGLQILLATKAKRFYFFAIMLLFFRINSQTDSKEKFFLTSIPKCGTWFLEKTVRLITGKRNALLDFYHAGILRGSNLNTDPYAIQLFEPSVNVLDRCTFLKDNEFMIAHLAYKDEYEDLLTKKNMKIIFIIRDPRDQLVSRVFYTYKHPGTYPGLQHLSFEELLLGFMGAYAPIDQYYPDLLQAHIRYINKPIQKSLSNITQFYGAFTGWLNSSLCLTIKFEDLVGTRGGGSDTVQKNTIQLMGKFLGISLSDKNVLDVANDCFGGSGTFREGKIGSWKHEFTPEQKELFKIYGGQLLIDLGYEKDLNW